MRAQSSKRAPPSWSRRRCTIGWLGLISRIGGLAGTSCHRRLEQALEVRAEPVLVGHQAGRRVGQAVGYAHVLDARIQRYTGQVLAQAACRASGSGTLRSLAPLAFRTTICR